MPQDQDVEVAAIHVLETTLPHGLAIGLVAVHRLMPGLHQPVHDRAAFRLQIGNGR